jgi:hypothetical protein
MEGSGVSALGGIGTKKRAGGLVRTAIDMGPD